MPNFGAPIVTIGEYMPDALLPDTLKQTHMLSEYLGKYILLNFWETHCGPCVRSVPELKEIYETYKDRMTIVSINTDIYRYSFRKGTEVKKFTWPSLWNEGWMNQGIAARYKVEGIPAYFWISPEGIVLKQWNGYGPGSLKSVIKELLDD